MWDESSRQVKVVGWFGDGENYRDFFIGDGTQTEFSRTNLDWGSLDTYHSRVVTHKFILYPELLFDAVQPQLLPLKDRVILKNQAGFPRSVYKWQYSLDAGASWIDIPASLIDSSPLGSLSIEGKDLMTEAEYLELVRQGKNIQFRIDNPVKPSSTITLRTSISTPHILSSEISLERCNHSGDASVKFQFDRALYPAETLHGFVLNSAGQTIKSISDVRLNANRTATIEGLPSGTYIFRFQNNVFELIGYESDSYMRNTGEEEKVSINFSTNKVKSTTGGNMFEDAKDKPKDKWRNAEFEKKYILDEMTENTLEEILGRAY